MRGLSVGDIALPAVLAVAAATELAALRIGPLAVTEIPSSAACLLLIWRRRWPMLVAPAALLLIVAQELFGIERDEPSTPIGIIWLACYTLGRHVKDLRGLLGIGVMYTGIWLAGGLPSPSDIPFIGVLTVGPWMVGRIVLAHARSSDASAAEARRLEDEQSRAAREAVRAERARIARELHDVIAHSVSVMVIQAGAAESLLRNDPQRAARAMEEGHLPAGAQGCSDAVPVITKRPQVPPRSGFVVRHRGSQVAVELAILDRPGLGSGVVRATRSGRRNPSSDCRRGRDRVLSRLLAVDGVMQHQEREPVEGERVVGSKLAALGEDVELLGEAVHGQRGELAGFGIDVGQVVAGVGELAAAGEHEPPRDGVTAAAWR